MSAPAFAVSRRGEQSIHDLFHRRGVGPLVGQKSLYVVRCWWQTNQVVAHASNPGGTVRDRRWHEFCFTQLRVDISGDGGSPLGIVGCRWRDFGKGIEYRPLGTGDCGQAEQQAGEQEFLHN